MEGARETHGIKVMNADGTIDDAVAVSYWVRGPGDEEMPDQRTPDYRVDLETGGKSYQGKGGDYFDALADLRKQLEPLGMRLLCFGARRDVWASGMQRDMGSGSEAYLLSDPRPGRKPAFSIWDYAPPETIGTVAEQAEYSKKWSSRRRSDRV